jgi:hypothetical protein
MDDRSWCIEFHSKNCAGWIIVMGLRVLLTTHYRNVSRSRCCYNAFSAKKGFMKKYLCWFAHGEPYVLYETMVKEIVGSTSSISNMRL